MSDRFQPIRMNQLTRWVFEELANHDSIFGIPRSSFFIPRPDLPYRSMLYGHPLGTPVGVAAGPHSQMAQNIVVAWLCGARFIELKTVQTLDELDVAKPCIDMEDEGYNVEWSQELKIRESFDEYLRAWVLIHALQAKLDFDGDGPGAVFNMSVGYDYDGIQQPNVQAYLDEMQDASAAIGPLVDAVAVYFPQVREVPIPGEVSNSVTLSTMHGCPPGEIEKICAYLLTERGLHTSVKLNPTLLGPTRVRRLLNNDLGFHEVDVPDAAFEHDLKWADAVPMLTRLRTLAAPLQRAFGVKLTNTLEVKNWRRVFDPGEKQMYLSGRPLHVISTHLASDLSDAFDGDLPISFSAGADAFNIPHLLRSGIQTVTVCSDILKSGGYLRMPQYLENLDAAMKQAGAASLADFTCSTAKKQLPDFSDALTSLLARPTWSGTAESERAREACRGLLNLQHYARDLAANRLFRKNTFLTSKSKTSRTLGLFDCIEAPCADECPVNQDVPSYMRAVREGRFADAAAITRHDNPLPSILGRVCDHLCEHTCVRTHLDEPLAIRDMKRFIMERATPTPFPPRRPANGIKVAVIGGGPAGLAAAYELAPNGFSVTIFEAQSYAGGMVAGTIPSYRLPQYVIDEDLRLIDDLGIEVRYECRAGHDVFMSDLRKEGFDYFVVTVGAQQGKRLGIEGEDAEGVLDALELLRSVREGRPPALGRRIGVIGAGDTAMDCARSAWRLTEESEVSVIYRRTVEQMPADREEIKGLLEEGIRITDLASPQRIVKDKEGRLTALVCNRCRLGEIQADGRRRFEELADDSFEIPLDTLVLAISQNGVFDFFDEEPPAFTAKGYLAVPSETMACTLPKVYAGGDAAADGPASIVKACGDGKRIAAAILEREACDSEGPGGLPDVDLPSLVQRRAHRAFRQQAPHRPPQDRKDFEEVVQTFSEAEAKREAERCLDCDLLCSMCVGVCPNLAIVTYRTAPFSARLPRLRFTESGFHRAGEEPFQVAQGFQVAILTDFCNECGNCVTFCPTSGVPYRDKPRLYLRRHEFEAEEENAFMLSHGKGHWSIDGRFGGQTHRLDRKDNTLTYRSPFFTARIDVESFALQEATPTDTSGPEEDVGLGACARMFVLAEGLTGSCPYLPSAEPR